MRKHIMLRWTPVAVDTLIELEEYGMPHVAGRIIDEGVLRDAVVESP